jgi:hypothetical protein
VLSLDRPEVRNAIDNAMRGDEMIAALERVGPDPDMRALLVSGAGGAFCSGEGVRGMLGGLRGAKRLAGHRGAPAADIEALLDAVLAFARMGEALGSRLVEVEINPLFAGAAGVVAADGLAVLTEVRRGPCRPPVPRRQAQWPEAAQKLRVDRSDNVRQCHGGRRSGRRRYG